MVVFFHPLTRIERTAQHKRCTSDPANTESFRQENQASLVCFVAENAEKKEELLIEIVVGAREQAEDEEALAEQLKVVAAEVKENVSKSCEAISTIMHACMHACTRDA